MMKNGRNKKRKKAPTTSEKKTRQIVRQELKKNLETKHVDFESFGWSWSDPNHPTWQGIDHNAYYPVQGVEANQRIGNEIEIKSFQLKVRISHSYLPTLLWEDTRVRIIIYQMIGKYGETYVAPSDILQVYTPTQLNPAINAFYNKDNGKNFRILYDKMFSLNYNTESLQQFVYAKITKGFHTHSEANVENTPTGQAQLWTNPIYVIMGYTSPAIGDPAYVPPAIAYWLRYNYTDA